jgi:hypothetical protein
MLSKIKAFCFNSLTIAWSYFLAFAGAVMQCIDVAADALGDPVVKDQITAAVGDAKTVGRILLGISFVTIVARLRSIKKAN